MNAPHIHIGYISSVLAPFNDVYGHIRASLHCYTDEARSDSCNSETLSSGIDTTDVVVEAVDHL